ncbi:uncharacterized protein I303_105614 [Kwoniella dejecticola CBS 10117]|uniref:YCII-related domain-containing protein n=2 Tax=Kwoniella dejecticola CBS 10117 TaxID=1296121 RepID=A0AAJ8MH01_9TREE
MLPTRSLLNKKMPLFYAICPDYSANPSETLKNRLKVRPEHWRRAEEDKKAGILEFGRGTVPPPTSTLHTDPNLPPGLQAMDGSIMFLRYKTMEQTWERIKSDVYYTGDVWDKDKIQIGQFIKLPGEGDD